MFVDLSADIQRAGVKAASVGKSGTILLQKSNKIGAKDFKKVYIKLSLDVLYVFKASNVTPSFFPFFSF